jgi:hypothetical protein
MKKITPTDIPEDLIEQLAERLQIETASAPDLIAYLANAVSAAVVDFDAERYFDQTRRDIARGYLDCLRREICRHGDATTPTQTCDESRSAGRSRETADPNVAAALRDRRGTRRHRRALTCGRHRRRSRSPTNR